MIGVFYRPQRSCEGYVFTRVCLSTGVFCLSTCWDTTPGSRYPSGSRHPPRSIRTRGAGIPQSRYPNWEQAPPGSKHPTGSRHSPGSRHPLEQAPPLEETPPSRQLLLLTVRILLECILAYLALTSLNRICAIPSDLFHLKLNQMLLSQNMHSESLLIYSKS